MVTARSDPRRAQAGAGAAVRRSQSSGRSSSATVGRASGLRQTLVQPLDPRPPRATVSQNAFPSLYWRSFSSIPSSRAITSASPPRLARRASRRDPKAGVAGIERLGRRVHHVLGVSLDHRHRRLERVERPGLLRARRAAEAARRASALGPSLAGPRRSSRLASARQRGLVEPRRGAVDQSPEQPGQMGSQPGHRAELDRVGDLVDGDPAQEEIRRPRRAGRGPRPGSGPRTPAVAARLGARQREVVLAQRPCGPRSRPRPPPRRPPRRRPAIVPGRPNGPGSLIPRRDPPLEPARELAQAANGQARPLGAIDQLRRRQRPAVGRRPVYSMTRITASAQAESTPACSNGSGSRGPRAGRGRPRSAAASLQSTSPASVKARPPGPARPAPGPPARSPAAPGRAPRRRGSARRGRG